MYDPDNPKNKERMPSQPHSEIRILSEKDKLRFYLINSTITRKRFGFGWVNGKLVIEDVAILRAVDGETKALLKELYSELK